MLVDGVPVEHRTPDGRIRGHHARVLDFDQPDANDWLAVNQFTVVEGKRTRRLDVVLFVNGLPLGVVELKDPSNPDATIHTAWRQLQTYKAELPTLFAMNEIMGVSDGVEARFGTLTGGWEWFKPWRTIDGDEKAGASASQLQVAVEGLCAPRRLLDMIRDFIVFEDDGGGELAKKMAGYHQYHAVRVAVGQTLRATRMQDEQEAAAVRPFPPVVVPPDPRTRYVATAPLVPLKAAAGAFGDPRRFPADDFEWARIRPKRPLRRGMFVAQVVGQSMEPQIPDGAWCLFSAPVEGTRQGKTVLMELRDEIDPETGERYTVKRYESEKAGQNEDGDRWRHARVTLKPRNPRFQPIVLAPQDEGQVHVVAELVEALDRHALDTGPKPALPGDRRVGVVWHTQGSGKSLTMAFYAGAHRSRAGHGEPHAGGPHRPQRPGRAALRHLLPLPGPAAPAAGAGRGPGRLAPAAGPRGGRRRLHHDPEVLPGPEGRPASVAVGAAQHRGRRGRGVPPSGRRPKTPEALRERLRGELAPDQGHKIRVVVVDVSRLTERGA